MSADSDSSSVLLIIGLLIVLAIVVAFVLNARNKPDLAPIAKRPTILVCGATGVGKSTLINTLLGAELSKTGQGEPVTQNTDRVATENSEFVFYDSKGLEVADASQTYLLLMSDLLRLRFGPNPFEQIDFVLMCIQEPQGRVDDAHREIAGLCEDLRIPLGIALTKKESSDELECFVRKMFKSAVFVRRIRSRELKLPNITIPAEGVPEIIADLRAAIAKSFSSGEQRAVRGRGAQALADSARRLAASGIANDSAWVGFGKAAWSSLGMQNHKWDEIIKVGRLSARRHIVPNFIKRRFNTRFDDEKIDAAIARRLLPIMMRRFADGSARLQQSDFEQAETEAIASFENDRPYRSRF